MNTSVFYQDKREIIEVSDKENVAIIREPGWYLATVSDVMGPFATRAEAYKMQGKLNENNQERS